MNRLYKCAAAAALAILAAAPQAWAASPSKVSYQGTLRKDGRLFSGTASMEFRVVNADASTEYWNSGSTDVVVSTGLFRYPLGTPNSAQFAAIDWKDITPYVQMRVDGLWLPPEPLYSSVYSLHAVTAESSTGTFTVNGGDLRLSGAAGSDGVIFPDGTVQYYAPGWSVAPTLTYTSFAGSAALGLVTPQTRLDVQAAGGDQYVQFWKDSSGVLKASMTASGLLYADGSALRNLPGGADSLGTHIATMTLRMNGFPIVNAGSATVSGQLTTYSSATVAGASGVGAPRLELRPGVELSSTTAAFYGGVYVSTNIYLPAGAKYYGNGSALTGITLTDTLGTHVATTTLQMAGFPIVNVGSITVTGPVTSQSSVTVNGALGVTAARLVVRAGVQLSSAAAAAYGGIQVSTHIYLPAGAKYYGDGSSLTGLTGVADNLGSHIATTTLLMGGFPVENAGAITANGQVTTYSSATVADPLGLGAARLRLAQGVELSSAPAAAYGGVQVSTHIYLPAGAKYYGDASGLTISASNISAGTLPDARLSAAVPLLASTQTFTGAAIFRSSAVFAYQGLSLPGVEISSGLRVNNGSVGIGVASPLQKLEVAGGVKIANSNIPSAGTLRYTAGNFEGYNGASWVALNGSFSLDTSTALWGINNTVLPNTVYAVGLASNVALGTMDAGVSKLRVTGYDNSSGYNAFLAESLDSTQLFRVRNDGNVAVGPHNPTTRLDVWAQAADPYVQVWRDSSGLVVSSMTVGGVLFADASGIRNLPGGADSLGTHVATMTLQMGSYPIINVGSVTANAPLTVYSSATVAGALGLGAARLRLAQGVELSSAPAAAYGGVQVSTNIFLPAGAKYYGDGSALSGISIADTLGTHVATMTLDMAGFPIANAGGLASAGEITTYSSATVAGELGLAAPRLWLAQGVELSSAPAAAYGGVQVSTHIYLAAGAKFYGDGTGLTGITGASDSLGSHIATTTLQMAGFQIVNAGSVTISGALGLASARVRLAQGVELSSAPAAAYGGVQVSTNIFLPAGAKYYGDGSGLSGISVADTLGTHVATTTLQMAGFQIVNAGSITITSTLGLGSPRIRLASAVAISSAPAGLYGGVYVSSHVYLPAGARYYGDGSALSLAQNVARLDAAQTFSGYSVFAATAVFGAEHGALPGLYVSSGLVVGNGSVGIGEPNPVQKLEVAGGVRIGNSAVNTPGTIRYSGSFEGYNGTGWVALNGSYSVDNSGALWGLNSGVTPNTVYTVGASSNVAIGTMDAGISKLRVTGAGNTAADNALLAESLDFTQLFRVRNDGSVAVGPQNPAARLDVRPSGTDEYAQIWRDSGGLEVASVSASGYLQAAKFIGDGSGLTNVNIVDNLAATLAAGNSAGWTYVNNLSSAAIGSAGGEAALDVTAVFGDQYAQIWRNSSGIAIASVNVAGQLFADASQLSNLPSGNVVDTLADTLAAGGSAGGAYINSLSSAAIGLVVAEAPLDVAAAPGDAYTQIWRGPTGVVMASMTVTGRLFADGSGLSNLPAGNTVDTLAATLGAGKDAGGAYINNLSSVVINQPVGEAVLDVKPFAGDAAVQIWRDSDNELVSSMTQTGVLYADGSQLRNLPQYATQDFNMRDFKLINASTITAAPGEPGIAFSTTLYVGGNVFAAGGAVLSAGPLLVGTQLPLASVHVSSGAGFAGDMVLLSTGGVGVVRMTGNGDVYASQFHGDGSALTGVLATGGMNNPATGGLDMSAYSITNAKEVEVSSNIAVGTIAGITPGVALLAANSYEEADITAFNVGVGGISLVNPTTNHGAGEMAVGGNFRGGVLAGNSKDFPMLIGVRATAWTQTTGNVTSARGIYVQNEQTGGALTENYGIYIDAPNRTGGTIQENAGLFIADQSPHGSVTTFNIYSSGTASKNYFDGAVTVNSRLTIPSKTLAQLKLVVPLTVGEVYYCSSCSPAKMVVSTGTAAGNFADPAGGTFK